MKRRNAREYALQFLYQIDFLEVGASEHALRDTLGTFWAGVTEKDGDVRAFTEDLILGTIGNLTPIDREIQRAADKWDLGRMASVDRTILRIGAYELLYRPEIPGAVSINEASEIAKKYSTADSASFINGLLDRIAREVRSGEKKNAKKPLQS